MCILIWEASSQICILLLRDIIPLENVVSILVEKKFCLERVNPFLFKAPKKAKSKENSTFKIFKLFFNLFFTFYYFNFYFKFIFISWSFGLIIFIWFLIFIITLLFFFKFLLLTEALALCHIQTSGNLIWTNKNLLF